jgi:transposase
MLRYKNQLYFQVGQYLRGELEHAMSMLELQNLEKVLLTGVENELALITVQIWQVADQIEALETNYSIADNKTRRRFLALVRLFCRLTRNKCRLIRTHYYLMDHSNNRNDLLRFAFQHFPPSKNEIGSLLSPFIRSSQKTTFFYSKLFRKTMDLTNEQWNAVKNLLPQKFMRGAGRPPQETRAVLNGILWKLRTGASWNDLPSEYPSHQTCYRRYTEWVKTGVLDQVIQVLVKHLKQNEFSITDSIENGEIEFVQVANQLHIFFAPHLQDTWQASTSLLILQVFINKKRKLGMSHVKITYSYPLLD